MRLITNYLTFRLLFLMSRMKKNSLVLSLSFLSIGGTICSVLGISMKDIMPLSCFSTFAAISIRLLCILVTYLLASFLCYKLLQYIQINNYNIAIGGNNVSIKRADIFKENAWRVIPVDTHFQTTVDDIIISKNSLHGQLVLQHGKADDINQVVKQEAKNRRIKKGENGYSFELGTGIRYTNEDGDYIMVALTELNKTHEAHTNRSQFENTLIRMWKEIDRVYAKKPVALPVLGSGITRFDDAKFDLDELIMCMLTALKNSNVYLKSNISILLYSEEDKKALLSLYERYYQLQKLR